MPHISVATDMCLFISVAAGWLQPISQFRLQSDGQHIGVMCKMNDMLQPTCAETNMPTTNIHQNQYAKNQYSLASNIQQMLGTFQLFTVLVPYVGCNRSYWWQPTCGQHWAWSKPIWFYISFILHVTPIWDINNRCAATDMSMLVAACYFISAEY